MKRQKVQVSTKKNLDSGTFIEYMQTQNVLVLRGLILNGVVRHICRFQMQCASFSCKVQLLVLTHIASQQFFSLCMHLVATKAGASVKLNFIIGAHMLFTNCFATAVSAPLRQRTCCIDDASPGQITKAKQHCARQALGNRTPGNAKRSQHPFSHEITLPSIQSKLLWCSKQETPPSSQTIPFHSLETEVKKFALSINTENSTIKNYMP